MFYVKNSFLVMSGKMPLDATTSLEGVDEESSKCTKFCTNTTLK